MSGSVDVDADEGRLAVSTDHYSLSWRRGPSGLTRSPYLRLADGAGRRWLRWCAMTGAHTVDGADETLGVDEPEVVRDGDDVVVRIAAKSTRWAERTLELRCTPDAVEASIVLSGTGLVTDVTMGGGDGLLPTGASGTFRSGVRARSLYAPAPTEPVAFTRPASAPAVLGVVGDADPGRLHGIFSPPPLTLAWGRAAPVDAVDPPDGDWLALSVRAPVADLGFTQLRYEPLDGAMLLRLRYEGHLRVEGSWRSPAFVIRPVADARAAVAVHRDDLIAAGHAPAGAPAAGPSWWTEPMFCGWGAQVALSRHRAPDLCRQEVYDGFLGGLARAGLDPGTIVVDDRWQAEYGSAEPDAEAWPDLAGWIAGRHAEGRRVLLWWRAWDPRGLPASECITDAAGRPVAADPGSPAYRRRLTSIIRRLVADDGLGADGLKVDFTQRTPSGRTLRSAPDSDGVWGIAALHRLMRCLYEAVKAARPDGLVIGHAVHPSFADVQDMVRTNDVLKRDAAGRRVSPAGQLVERVGIVRRALPAHPVDTDQWPMPDRARWRDYVRTQAGLGVPALYYVERIRAGEPLRPEDLALVRRTWDRYRRGLR